MTKKSSKSIHRRDFLRTGVVTGGSCRCLKRRPQYSRRSSARRSSSGPEIDV